MNDNYSEVSNADYLQPGNITNGNLGTFKPYVASTYTSTGEVEVTFHLNLSVACLLFDQDSCYVTYLPHNGISGGAYGGAPFYEVVLAHERAHAAYFFDTELSQIREYLMELNVDSGIFGANLDAAVREAFYAIHDNIISIYGSGERANQATYDYFAGNPSWHQLPDENGRKRWSKYE